MRLPVTPRAARACAEEQDHSQQGGRQSSSEPIVDRRESLHSGDGPCETRIHRSSGNRDASRAPSLSRSGIAISTSQICSFNALRTNPRRMDHHVYSTFRPRSSSDEIRQPILKPFSLLVRKRQVVRVSTDAEHTFCRVPGQRASAAAHSRLRQREDIQRPPWSRVVRQICHGVHESESARSIFRIETAGDNCSCPAAYARQDCNGLFAVGPLVTHGLPNDAGPDFKLPQQFSVPRIQRFEPAIHRSVKDHVSGGDNRTTPGWEHLPLRPRPFCW